MTKKASKSSFIENLADIQKAAFRGLHKLDVSTLRAMKGAIKNQSPTDFMHKQEMAANLFMLTETEAKIRNAGITGNRRINAVARMAGKAVRNTMIKTSGTRLQLLTASTDLVPTRRDI
jgi:DNA-damage-inducible protein D